MPVLGTKTNKAAEKNLFPDIDATAQKLVAKKWDRNYSTFRAVKDCPEKDFNLMIRKVAKVIGDKRASMTAEQLAANEQLLNAQQDSLNKIVLERELDHHPFLIDHLNSKIAAEGLGITLLVDDRGVDGAGKPKQLLQFQETIDHNSGIPGAEDWLKSTVAAFYTSGTPLEHKLVIEELKVAGGVSVAECGGI